MCVCERRRPFLPLQHTHTQTHAHQYTLIHMALCMCDLHLFQTHRRLKSLMNVSEWAASCSENVRLLPHNGTVCHHHTALSCLISEHLSWPHVSWPSAGRAAGLCTCTSFSSADHKAWKVYHCLPTGSFDYTHTHTHPVTSLQSSA